MDQPNFETYLKLAADWGGIRYEVLGGLPYSTGMPGWQHQDLLFRFGTLLYGYVFGRTHSAQRPRQRRRVVLGGAPIIFGDANPAVPDLMYAELDAGGRLPSLEGEPLEIVPDLVVEVVSVDSRLLDREVKVEIFGRAGVREYWIVDPGEACVLRFNRGTASGFDRPVLRHDGLLESRVVGGFAIDVPQVLGQDGGNARGPT